LSVLSGPTRMSHQPNLFSSSPTDGSAVPDNRSSSPGPPRIPVWLRRIELFLYVVLRIYIGVIVLVLPWTPLWTNNLWLNYFPRVATFLMYGAVRGIISGLGLLNLWIAIGEAVHYRESSS
jgi:hypothetical protein